MRSRFALIFAASGAAALIYEVTWTRLLTLQVGHGVAAASTVLAAFMGGLAAGSAIGGRTAARFEPARALRVYAGLELAIAVLALILPFELRAVDPLLRGAYADGAGGAAFGLLRLGTGLLLLSIPTAAMGATFPIASRWFVSQVGRAARDAGALYAANTVGAAVGALLAGFVLLPRLGLAGSTWVGVLLDLLAAAGAWQIAGTTETRASAPAPAGAPPELAAAVPPKRHRRRGPQAVKPSSASLPQPALAALALGVSGFASLTLQVVWTRLLALMLGPTTYAFSTMVAIFIAGIAVGSAIAARLAPRMRQPIAGLAICLTASVGGGALAAGFIDRALMAVATFVSRPEVTYADVLTRQAMLVIGLLGPMTIAFGAAFPFAVAVAARRDDTIAADLGGIYAANTTGAIAGALLAGFVFIPWIGLHGTIRLVTLVGGVSAIAILLAGGTAGRTRLLAGTLALAVCGLGLALPDWDRLLLSSGQVRGGAAGP